MTSHCVKKVKELWEQDPTLAKRIDENMQASVKAAAESLQMSATEGLEQLSEAINKAKICFTQWGLASGKVEQHINQLLETGALAAKPTGSGDGGYVLSLWAEPAPEALLKDMIAV